MIFCNKSIGKVIKLFNRNVNICRLTREKKLSFRFIRRYCERVDWEWICCNYSLPEEFIR